MAKRRSRKKKFRWKRWLVLLLVALVALTYLWYKSLDIEAAKFARYPAFGIGLPEGYTIHGIDVSWYQGSIDWKAVKEMQVKNVKIGFAFIKSTEGVGLIDKQFKRNWKKAGEAGLARGAYHFFLANKSGKMQALNFIKNVKLNAGDLPPVLDVEELYGSKPEAMRKEVQDWLTAIEAYYNVKPVIYTNVSFYASFMGSQFKSYPLWAAHYHEPNKPRIARPWLFWQHSENGRVNGIVTRVDFNVFNGDSTEFANLLIN